MSRNRNVRPAADSPATIPMPSASPAETPLEASPAVPAETAGGDDAANVIPLREKPYPFRILISPEILSAWLAGRIGIPTDFQVDRVSIRAPQVYCMRFFHGSPYAIAPGAEEPFATWSLLVSGDRVLLWPELDSLRAKAGG